MAIKYDDWGNPYEVPPYSKAADADFYRRTANVVAFSRPARRPQTDHRPTEAPQDRPAKSRPA